MKVRMKFWFSNLPKVTQLKNQPQAAQIREEQTRWKCFNFISEWKIYKDFFIFQSAVWQNWMRIICILMGNNFLYWKLFFHFFSEKEKHGKIFYKWWLLQKKVLFSVNFLNSWKGSWKEMKMKFHNFFLSHFHFCF